MQIDLTGKRALVTGSTTGIGYAIAKSLAEAGAAVIVHGRNAERVAEARRRLERELPHANVEEQAADLADASAIQRLVEAVPSVDILVSNAGTLATTPFLELGDAEWQRYQDVYVTAPMRLSRHYLPRMLERNWGRILCSAGETCSYTPGDVHIASSMTAWLTSKAALLGLARSLAEIAAGTGVTVNAFIPGPAHTAEAHTRAGLTPDFAEFSRDYFSGPGMSSVIRRFLRLEEVADLVVFLASEKASGITGATLRVDGGILRKLS
jgi:NAD(P)-dependent dehydrogenase (short-subunit alcohol dehydrogenase family)